LTGKPAAGSKPRAATREVTVLNRFGIHARPAALFVKTVGRYNAQVKVEKGGVAVSARSIIGLLTLEAYQGVKLRLVAEGADAEAALDALEALFKQKFNED
jgi:phosphocarrier protein HPr